MQLNDEDQEKGDPVLRKLLEESEKALKKKLDEAEQKNTQYWDRILRMQADMENAARRAEREMANAHKYALEKFVNELLPVIDNLERALAASKDSKADIQAILEGLELTLKMLHDVLAKSGIKQIDPINEVFNPSFHEAVSMQDNPEFKSGYIIAVLQKGYLLNDRLVRPAMVIVAK
jgi:molecular chaperone GrpE